MLCYLYMQPSITVIRLMVISESRHSGACNAQETWHIARFFFIQISTFSFQRLINPHLFPTCLCFSDSLNNSAFLQRTFDDYDHGNGLDVSSGGIVVSEPQTCPPGVVGHAGTTLGMENIKPPWGKSSETQGLLCFREVGGMQKNTKYKDKGKIVGVFFYRETDWLGLICVCSKVCSLLPCRRPAEERMTRQTARTQSNKGKSLTASPED